MKLGWYQNGQKHAKMGLFEVHCVSGPPATTIRQNDLILGDMLTSYMGMMHIVLIIFDRLMMNLKSAYWNHSLTHKLENIIARRLIMGSRYMFWTIAVVMIHIIMTSKVTLFKMADFWSKTCKN